MFNIQEELKKLPSKPGVYIMKDENQHIIYVGKAINLKNRVRQYFQQSAQHTAKTHMLVSNIAEFEYIITDSEVEALVLECNLIKQHRPKYNILLKDDKAFPYIKLTVNEHFPRVYLARKVEKDKAKYFGPYTNSTVKEVISLVNSLWQLRTCHKKFPRDIGRGRQCLNFHIGCCRAPCSGLVSEDEYDKMVAEVIQFINGRHSDILKRLEAQMAEHSENLEFEKAAELRDKILAVRMLDDKQRVEQSTNDDQDVIALTRADDEALVQVFFIRGGKMTGREHFMLEGVEFLTREEAMTGFVKQFYGETTYIPKEILLETEINDREIISEWLSELKGHTVTISVPKKGPKLDLVKLAYQNASLTFGQIGERLKREKQRTEGALDEIQNALGIDISLKRIEAYDISNIQGFESVGSMVVFENGRPKNSDYRKFKIKGVLGPNDYAAMEEVVSRRFSRYKAELLEQTEGGKFSTPPDIIFIDGGKGQVASAEKALAELGVSIPVCGMVKDDRHRTRGLYYNGVEINMPNNSEGFKLVTRIQDEVHRFAIEYHRKLRADAQIKSVLDDIPGIGGTRRKALIRQFGSVEGIKNAELAALASAESMNIKAAQAVYDFFHKGEEQ